ncbi:MAG: hypothetical protein ACKOOG_00010 [Actinomycetota bacterium]
MIGLVLIVVVIAVAVVLVNRNREHAGAAAHGDGVAAPATPASRIPVFAEAIGYIGGWLALGGILVVLGNSWTDLSEAVRLAISGLGAAVLLGAGAAIPAEHDPAFARLRGVVWLAATAATAVLAGVLVADVSEASPGQTIAFACAAAVAVESALLWRGRPDLPLQQLTALAASAVAVGTFVSQWTEAGPAGVPVWLTGVAFITLGLRRILRANPFVTVGLGALTASIGASMTVDTRLGIGLLVIVAPGSALLTLAVVPGVGADRTEQAVLGIVGGFTLLISLPQTLGHFARDAGVITGAIVWLVGAALIALGASHRVRGGAFVEALGALATIGGAALTGVQWPGGAPLLGIASAVGLIALGTRPGRVLLSAFGSLGLLVNVPWAIAWFFPGEGRAPLLMSVSGLLLVGIALFLARSGSRWRRELGGEPVTTPAPTPPTGDGPAGANGPTADRRATGAGRIGGGRGI